MAKKRRRKDGGLGPRQAVPGGEQNKRPMKGCELDHFQPLCQHRPRRVSRQKVIDVQLNNPVPLMNN